MNVNKIKARIREMGLIQSDVAKYLDIHAATLNKKINHENGYYLSVLETQKIINLLKIPEKEIDLYFFQNELT